MNFLSKNWPLLIKFKHNWPVSHNQMSKSISEGHFKIHCGFIAKLSLLWHKYLLYLMCFSLLFQSNFETMFREYELNATFHYLRSFRRVRVDFEAHFAASSAKLSLNGTPLGDNVIQCYFLQVSPIRVSLYFLSLKASNRQKRKFY